MSLGENYLAPNPYVLRWSRIDVRTTQEGFITFGAPHVLDAVTTVANLALRASRRQKWLLHRRLRPEEFGARVDAVVRGLADYPVHPELLGSAVHEHLTSGGALLPAAYPEGAPAHPSYPAGHAAIAGACATVLKASSRRTFRSQETLPASTIGLMPLRACGWASSWPFGIWTI